jgi:hypothetical protein
MRSLVLGVLTVAGLLGRARAENDSQTGLLGPREIAVGEGLRGGATGSSAIGLNPSGLPLNRELVFEGGYGYRTTDSASLVGISACDSTNVAPGCFFYEYIRSDSTIDDAPGDRSIHIAGLALSRLLVPRVSIGATAKYYRFKSSVGVEEDARGFVFDLGATVRLTELINVGIAAQNLAATEKTPQLPRTIGAGVHARPLPILALGFDMRWKLEDGDHGARFGGGAELFLRTGRSLGIPIRAGALHDGDTNGGNDAARTYVSGGLGLTGLRWGLDAVFRRQVAGGDETLLMASLRFFGPRMGSAGLGGID